MKWVIAKFFISKDDLYRVEQVASFRSREEAESYRVVHDLSEIGGGTWQERWEYHVVEMRNGLCYWPGGGRIVTVLDE